MSVAAGRGRLGACPAQGSLWDRRVRLLSFTLGLGLFKAPLDFSVSPFVKEILSIHCEEF